MIDKISTFDCVLCGSCVNICPVDAISYKKKYLDFLYPQIDNEKCIRCNKCEKVCPILDKSDQNRKGYPKAFISRNQDVNIRKKSTSGGIFFEFAKKIIENNGFVCGAVFDEKFHVHHICSNQINDIYRMMGSKYVQSNMKDCMKQAKDILAANKKVLFTGCPCQIAGFRTFLGKNYDNLILMELICHGIPSDTMLQNYIVLQEDNYGSKVKKLEFRNKEFGWHRSSVKIIFENGKKYLEPTTVDAYMKGFYGSTYLKESCYNCNFKEFKSGADLIVGDFWGAEAELPEMDDNLGLSAVIVNSKKGEKIFKDINLESIPFDLDKIIQYNQNILISAKKNINRSSFYHYAEKNGFKDSIHTFFEEREIARMKRKIIFKLRCVYYRIVGRGNLLY